jgi:Protein of unknown function (DUF3828)
MKLRAYYLLLALLPTISFAAGTPSDTVKAVYEMAGTCKLDAKGTPELQEDTLLSIPATHFSKKLLTLIKKDEEANKGEVGWLDFDPISNSQDPCITKVKVGKPIMRARTATVSVKFLNWDYPMELIYTLVKEQDVWKVDNIATAHQHTDGWDITRDLQKLYPQ